MPKALEKNAVPCVDTIKVGSWKFEKNEKNEFFLFFMLYDSGDVGPNSSVVE